MRLPFLKVQNEKKPWISSTDDYAGGDEIDHQSFELVYEIDSTYERRVQK